MHDTEMTKIHKEQILVGYNEGVSPPVLGGVPLHLRLFFVLTNKTSFTVTRTKQPQ